MYRKLKKEIEQLKEDYFYECQVVNDVIEWQEQFLDYLKSKIEQDNKNKKIYEEIINEFEKMMI